MKYFLKINCQVSGWFSKNIDMVNNTFCSITIYQVLYNNIWYQIYYVKCTDNIPVQFFRYLIFVILYETRYDQHNYFQYYIFSIIEPFILRLKIAKIKFDKSFIQLSVDVFVMTVIFQSLFCNYQYYILIIDKISTCTFKQKHSLRTILKLHMIFCINKDD